MERTGHVKRWKFGVALNVFNWVFGLYYENAIREMTVLLGPLTIWCSQEPETGCYLPSGSLFMMRQGSFEWRIDGSTHQLLLGYARSRYRDHSLYFGPLDLQIEHVGYDLDEISKRRK